MRVCAKQSPLHIIKHQKHVRTAFEADVQAPMPKTPCQQTPRLLPRSDASFRAQESPRPWRIRRGLGEQRACAKHLPSPLAVAAQAQEPVPQSPARLSCGRASSAADAPSPARPTAPPPGVGAPPSIVSGLAPPLQPARRSPGAGPDPPSHVDMVQGSPPLCRRLRPQAPACRHLRRQPLQTAPRVQPVHPVSNQQPLRHRRAAQARHLLRSRHPPRLLPFPPAPQRSS
mmetsp:Transcript_15068/g.43090  ORF Transcript_15068/g.43090 Transcript_15068/m.43090 type:complete len:229 (-) Transcript_15068:135-821(-)